MLSPIFRPCRSTRPSKKCWFSIESSKMVDCTVNCRGHYRRDRVGRKNSTTTSGNDENVLRPQPDILCLSIKHLFHIDNDLQRPLPLRRTANNPRFVGSRSAPKSSCKRQRPEHGNLFAPTESECTSMLHVADDVDHVGAGFGDGDCVIWLYLDILC